jgi:predicted acylesterase/phospholipase RssA
VHKGRYDSQALFHYISNTIGDILDPETGFYRKVTVGAVQAASYQYRRVDLDRIRPINFENIATAIQGSASIPVVHEPVSYSGKYFLDGAVVLPIDPEAAIKRCFELVSRQEDIVLDISYI